MRVTAPAACPWSAQSNAPWLSITASGTGGTSDVKFTAQANPSGTPRSGSLTVANTTYTVNQAGAACSFGITGSSTSPTFASGGAAGQSVGFASTIAGCTAPVPASYASWITVDGSTFAGQTGSVTYSVAANPFGTSRQGTIQVGSAIFTVVQSGAACGYSLNEYGHVFRREGGDATALGSPTAPACTPEVGTNQPSFITLGTLTGPELNIFSLPYTVAPFGTPLATEIRFGLVTFGGRVISIKQVLLVRRHMTHSTSLVRGSHIRFRRLAIAAVVAGCSFGGFAASKGPDAGGYSASDETIYSFVDISGASGAAATLAGTDDGTAPVTLPFAFRLYGTSYPVACISTNGAVYLLASAVACTGFDGDFANTDLTAAAVPSDRPAILPFWSDLTFQQPGAGGVLYQTIGTAPDRRMVIQWNNAFPQGSTSPVTFQMILGESDNSVIFQYKSVALDATDPSRNGAHATVGIRNAGAPSNSQLLQWSYNVPVIADKSAIRYSSGVVDAVGPTINATAPGTLWPPNGKTVPVQVRGTISDNGSGVDRASARFSVTDEYGAVQPSGAIVVAANGSFTVNVPLVADRVGADRDGRTYTIVVSAHDNAGNVGRTSVVVVVPHDQGK